MHTLSSTTAAAATAVYSATARHTLPPQQRPLFPAAANLPNLSSLSAFATALLVIGCTTAFLLLTFYRTPILHFLSPSSDPRPLTETEQNTERNRSGSSDEDAIPPRRRGLRHRTYSDEGELQDEKVVEEVGEYRMLSKPIPKGVRSCIKGPASPAPAPAVIEEATSTASTATSEDSASTPTRKSVRVVDPEAERASLEALREFWSAPASHGQGSGGAQAGSNGIAGYRRTRDIYTKGQGGTAVIKRAPAVVKVNEGEASGGETTTASVELAGDTGSVSATEQQNLDRRRSPRLSLPSGAISTSANRASSPSPSPTSPSSPATSTRNRLASASSIPQRTASPLGAVTQSQSALARSNSPASSFIVGRAGTAGGRGVSPSPVRVALRKRGSGSGKEEKEKEEVGAGVVSPRWVRNKEGKGRGGRQGVGIGESKKEGEERDGEVEGEVDEDEGFEDVSASDTSGANTPTRAVVELPSVEDEPAATTTGDEEKDAPPASTERYPLRSRESTPVPSPPLTEPPALPTSTMSSSSTTSGIPRRRVSLTSGQAAPLALAAGGGSSPKGALKGGRGVVVL